jgi:ubiquitin C-terminal hydrolase
LDTTWYHYDDEVCEEIPERLVKSPAAYILFYKRRNV